MACLVVRLLVLDRGPDVWLVAARDPVLAENLVPNVAQHPCRSGGMFVFVQDASEAIASSDPEPGNLVWFGDQDGQWVQGSGVARPW
jgi:hypothetical protein